MGASIKPARSRGAVDHTARAKRLRDRAEECRTLARIVPSEAGAAADLRYAEGYDTLAKQQERLACDAAELKINKSAKLRRGGSRRILRSCRSWCVEADNAAGFEVRLRCLLFTQSGHRPPFPFDLSFQI